MFKLRKTIPFLFASLCSVAALSGCSTKEKEKRVLRVFNTEDYIYECEEEGFYCDECEDYVNNIHFDEENEIYICNECGSEVYEDMDMMDQFVKYWKEQTGEDIDYVYDTFDTNETMYNELQTGKTNYDVCIPSDYMIQKLLSHDMLHKLDRRDDIWANISPFLTDRFSSIITENGQSILDYSVPYMWGTMGIMYNPTYYAEKLGIPEEEVHEDFKSWDVLYSKKYKGTFSIKDSVRDTYTVCLTHAYADQIALATTTDELDSIFNQHDETAIEIVKQDMLVLKENAFGFECDSGKTDMTTQKIGANLAWSGDATWAISVAEDPSLDADEDEEIDPDDSLILYYSIPIGKNKESAVNLWFDGMCIPKHYVDGDKTKEDTSNYDLAEAFMEFMCMPEYAVQNSDYVGYTPGSAGEAMLDYMYDCYDVRGEVGGEVPEGFVEGVDYYKYDISYFYENTFNTEGDDAYQTEDGILYAYPEYVDRQLRAQYPEKDQLDRLAIMKDFGDEGNIRLLDMWESVRTNKLPLWAILVFIIEGIAAIALVSYFITKKLVRRKLKKARI